MTMPFDNDRFDAYVRDELPAGERAGLEAELAADRARGGALSREWDEHLDAADAVALTSMRERVRAAGQRYGQRATTERTARVRPLWRRNWAVAAAVAALLVAGGYFALSESRAPRDPSALAAVYFEPAVGLPTLLGPAEDIRFEDGMVDYKLGDYEAALQRWRPLLGEDFDQDTLAFYLGVAELGAGRADEALAALQRVGEDGLRERADWFAALAQLELGRVAEARGLLQEVIAGGGRYSEEAEALMRELGAE